MPDDPLTDYTWPPILRNRGEGWDQFFDLAFLIVGMVAGLVLSAFGWWCVIPVLVAFAILGAKYCFKEAKNEQRAADSRVKDTAVADAEAKVKRIRKAATQSNPEEYIRLTKRRRLPFGFNAKKQDEA